MTKLMADNAMRFIIENSGLSAPMTMEPTAPSHTQDTRNIPETIVLNGRVTASMLLKIVCEIAGSDPNASGGKYSAAYGSKRTPSDRSNG